MQRGTYSVGMTVSRAAWPGVSGDTELKPGAVSKKRFDVQKVHLLFSDTGEVI